MKIKNENEEQQLTSKTPHWRFSQAKKHRWESFILKNDCRSIISITLTSKIVLHLVAISTFNKNNGYC